VSLIDTLPSLRPSGPVERAVYRIVQEALNNVVKHAQATRVVVRLEQQDDTLKAVIEDNGIGFDTLEAVRPGHRRGLGLLGIRERVAQLNGVMHLESAVGTGTRVEISLSTRSAEPESVTAGESAPDLLAAEATWR
jgi:signal transduction histidine kinase